MQEADFEKLLAETLAAHGRTPSTQETYTLMLRLFGRYLDQTRSDKALDAVAPEDIEAYQRYLVTERKVRFSSFNQSTCALQFFYRTCLRDGLRRRESFLRRSGSRRSATTRIWKRSTTPSDTRSTWPVRVRAIACW